MFTQILTSGFSNGALYALIAFGFVVIFNVTGWINFPQGQYMFIGAFFALSFISLNIPLLATVILSIIITIIISVLFERLTLGRMRQPNFMVAVMILSGAMFLYDGLMMVCFGKFPKSMAPFSKKLGVSLLGSIVPSQSLWMIGITIVLGFTLWFFFSRHIYGKAMRAVAQNQLASKLVGINVRTMTLLAVALSSGIGAIAGIVIAPMTFVVFNAGMPYTMKGFVSAVIGGGLISYPGAFLGGLLVGLAEAFITGYVTSLFKDVVLFSLLIIVLIWRPSGILGSQKR